MQRPSSFTVTTSGNSAPYPLDRYVNGYAVGVTMPTAGAVYTLQYSYDDPFANYSTSYNANGTWFNWDDATLVNASANKSTNLSFIPAAIRISVSAKCSAGRPVTVTVIPMGMDE